MGVYACVQDRGLARPLAQREMRAEHWSSVSALMPVPLNAASWTRSDPPRTPLWHRAAGAASLRRAVLITMTGLERPRRPAADLNLRAWVTASTSRRIARE